MFFSYFRLLHAELIRQCQKHNQKAQNELFAQSLDQTPSVSPELRTLRQKSSVPPKVSGPKTAKQQVQLEQVKKDWSLASQLGMKGNKGDDYPKPKRPPQAYLLYCNVRMKELSMEPQTSPLLTFSEKSTQIGKEWQEMSEDEKAPYR